MKQTVKMTFAALGKRKATLAVEDGNLVLKFRPAGLVIVIK